MAERRSNSADRQQAQQWFDALRAHIAGQEGQTDVTERLKAWATLEDVMSECPTLLPLLLNMAWQLRAQPSFAELFKTSGGALAQDTTTALSPCGKTFDQVVLSHLQDSMRVYCVHQQDAWLMDERKRHQPKGLATITFLAPLMKKLKRETDADFLEHYPQHDLFAALKPLLIYPRQFALIEAFATMSTRTVAMLGACTRGLLYDPSIRNIGSLESAKCKFVIELAKLFTETQIAAAEAARGAAIPTANPISPAPARAQVAEITGAALSHLTVNGLHLSKAIILVRDQARDIVAKMSLAMGFKVWAVFADKELALNVAHCPMPLAKALGEHALHVNHKTSEALHAIKNPALIEVVVGALVLNADVASVAQWAANA